MRKFLIQAVLILALSGSAIAGVNHFIETGPDTTEINSSIQIECTDECPVTNWQLDWRIPAGSEVQWVEGSDGEAENVEVEDGRIQIETETPPQNSEVIDIGIKLDRSAENIRGGLYQREISLPGMNDQETSLVAGNKNLISGSTGPGFVRSFEDEEMKATGEGPTNLVLNFGDLESTEYYSFTGLNPSEDIDDAFELSTGVTGRLPEYQNILVAVLEDGIYNESVNDWSSGAYSSGVVKLREDLDEGLKPVLAHETVHGLNHRYLDWDETRTVYFDEGTAEYTEYLMRKKLYRNDEIDVGPAEVFGDDREYRVEESGRDVIYTKPSRGDREHLWEYYQQDGEWMKQWNQEQFPEQREFGYAYSQLLIRDYVRQGGEVRELYGEIDSAGAIHDPEEKWEFFEQLMDMEPCNYELRERFDDCLDDINEHDYPVMMSSPDIESNNIVIREHELPERNESYRHASEAIDIENIGIDESYTEDMKTTLSAINRILTDVIKSVLG